MQQPWARGRRGQYAVLDVLLRNHVRVADVATVPGDSMERGASMVTSGYVLTVSSQPHNAQLAVCGREACNKRTDTISVGHRSVQKGEG